MRPRLPSGWQFGAWVGCSVILLVAAVLAIVSYGPVHGYQAQAILSGSMGRAAPKGSLVITRASAASSYKAGDIATYRLPSDPTILVTHRIVRVYFTPSGALVMNTKGDANSNGDPWAVPLGSVVGKVVVTVPFIGYGIAAVKTQAGFLAFTTFFFLFSASHELAWLLRYVRRMFLMRKGAAA